MKLPNPRNAIVEIEKLRGYSLNPNHPVGKHKARVFKAALGIDHRDAEWLRDKALEAAYNDEAEIGAPSEFGDKYLINSVLTNRGKSATVTFAWIVELGTDFPRLTTCYVSG